MKRPVTILLLLLTATVLASCDTTVPSEPAPLALVEEEVETLSDMLVGLWEKEDIEDLDWLFKEGGSYLAGDLNPINPIVGQWELTGDTLHINDTACFDAFAMYKIAIDVNTMTVEIILEECTGRGEALEGSWSRFIYGQ